MVRNQCLNVFNNNNKQLVTTTAQNLARTGLQTTRCDNQRFNLQHELQELNLQNIPGKHFSACRIYFVILIADFKMTNIIFLLLRI